VLTAVVTMGAQINVVFVATSEEGEVEHTATGEEHAEDMTFAESQEFCEFPFETEEEFQHGLEEGHPCEEGPSPLAIETKELLWGGGAFIVLALLMRFWLFPAVKRGMDERYSHIRSGHEQADAARAAARAEVAEYQAALATVKSEASTRIDAARQTLEAERTARLAAVNAEIAARREAAAAEAAAAREAVRGDIATAVADVASRTVELSVGTTPDAAAVRNAVDSVMGAGVGS
jgi:F-type H+-transporting ATPase subunit b